MKHVKMLSLAAVAAMALMAFVGAGTASATKLCSANENPCSAAHTYATGTTITSTLKSGTSAILETFGGLVRDTCTGSEVSGKTSNESGTTISGSVSTLSFSGCSAKTSVLEQTGTLEIGSKGEVTAKGFRVTVEILGESCVYSAGTGTALGTLTGGSPATLTVSATVNINTKESGANCATSSNWTATYTVTTPTSLFVSS